MFLKVFSSASPVFVLFVYHVFNVCARALILQFLLKPLLTAFYLLQSYGVIIESFYVYVPSRSVNGKSVDIHGLI